MNFCFVDAGQFIIYGYFGAMNTVSYICDTLGRKHLAEALGVKPTAVSNAVVQGKFPAKWYAVIKSLASEATISCPDDLFNFIAVDPPVASQPPNEDAA